MTTKRAPAARELPRAQAGRIIAEKSAPAADEKVDEKAEETPFEAAASICGVLVVGLFILTFLAQNFVIPSGSMMDTLLVGDQLDAVGEIPRAQARRRGGIHQALTGAAAGLRRQAAVFLPGQAAHRRARR